ncbi:ribosome-releasing factor 2, mitochondrial [Empidonax traillii]|uniref:ribosome-releasing factor 2, mitochondrial n=1 Tax=Empidonax traillii TaxID=164674 RepID=UPI000FFDBE53|nr:ribosome-releasing factor 2, mitochondrial [Empidonax traillii]
MLRLMRRVSVDSWKSSSLCSKHAYFKKTKMRVMSVTQQNCSLRKYSALPGDVKSLRSVINPDISRYVMLAYCFDVTGMVKFENIDIFLDIQAFDMKRSNCPDDSLFFPAECLLACKGYFCLLQFFHICKFEVQSFIPLMAVTVWLEIFHVSGRSTSFLSPNGVLPDSSFISVADLDDEFAELVLGEHSENFDLISAEKLQSAIRRVTLAHKAVPVLCGSALKNKGVQPLLDAITMYLPAPNERSYEFLQWYKDDLCALAFKVLHDKCRGPLVFVRVYSGSLKPQSAVYNINKSCTERMSRLLLPFADQHIEIPSLMPGNIALTVGLKQSATGDTIVSSKASAVAAARRAGRDTGEKKRSTSDVDSLLLAGVEIPDPVFFCTIEPPSMAKQQDLDNALSCLQREDPSLKVKIDPDTGQTILCGMGELHIEIIHDRIKREYGIETYLGPLQIAYRETILSAAQVTDILDKTVGDKRHFVTAELEVRPRSGDRAGTKPIINYAESVIEVLPQELQGAIENGIMNSCIQGPLLGFPVQDIDVTVQSLTVHPDTSHTMVSACVSRCMQKALKKAGIQILEPLMNLEITVSEDHLSAALADLAQRRGSIQEIQSRQDNRVVVAAVPLAEMMGYSTVLRSLTSGSATFTLELASYQALNSQEQSALLQRRMGLV